MSQKIIGVTVGSPLPKPNLMQTDPTKGDYIKGKTEFMEAFQPKGNYLESSALPTAINTALAQAKASGEFDGADGSPGSNGKDGTSVTVKSVSESAADGGSNVVTFSDGKTLTIKNGSKGSTGAAGKDGSDANVTATNIASALGYTPAKQSDVEQKANKQGLSLGVGSDGLVYLFVDGSAQGNGLDIKSEAVAGDVVGYVDENNTIILTGALADGTYVLKYEGEDGVQTEIGALDVGNVVKNIPLTWALGTRLDKATGKVTETGSTTYAATQYIAIVSGKTYTIRRNATALTYSGCSICWYDASGNFVSYTENFFGTGDADTKTEYTATVPNGATQFRLRMFYNIKGSTMADVAAGYSMTQE